MSAAERNPRGGQRVGARSWAAGLLGTALLAWLAPADMGQEPQPQPLPPAEQVIAQLVEAEGGEAAINKVRNRVSLGTFEYPALGIKAKLQSYEAKPCLSYTRLELEDGRILEEGTTEDLAWSLDSGRGARVKTGPERALALRHARLDFVLAWRELYQKAETTGIERVGERDCYKLVLTPPEGAVEEWYIDKSDHILRKRRLTVPQEGDNVQVDVKFTDHKKVDEVLLPHTLTITVNSQDRVIRLESIKQNADLPHSRFEPPEAVRELAKKGPTTKPVSDGG